MIEARAFMFGDMPKQGLMEGLFERTALRTNDSLVTFNWFQPGFPRQALHHHPFDQLALIISGTLKLQIGDKEIVAGPGSAVYIPPDVPHTGWPVGDEVVFNIDIFAPARADYLFLALNQSDWGPTPDAEQSAPFISTAR
jgi:hypothetical protein